MKFQLELAQRSVLSEDQEQQKKAAERVARMDPD
jgi:hypothetical protein